MCFVCLIRIHVQVMIELTLSYNNNNIFQILILSLFNQILTMSLFFNEFVKVIIYKMKTININNNHLV